MKGLIGFGSDIGPREPSLFARAFVIVPWILLGVVVGAGAVVLALPGKTKGWSS